MNAALKLECADFSTFFSLPEDEGELNLSQSSVLDILAHYQENRRHLNPHYTIGPLMYNIRLIQTTFNQTISPRRINENFHNLFVGFLFARGILQSTIKSYCQQLIAALRWATRYGAVVSPSFDSFKMGDFKRTTVALTPDEVSHIYHFDIDHAFADSRSDLRETLHRVRDMFVLSCNLGQRYSDMRRITPDCFNADHTIFSITQKKTGNRAVVDIRDLALDYRVVAEILERYDYTAPYPHSLNNYNHYLHLILKTIGKGFNRPIITQYKALGEIKELKTPKWKAIASHTGRRTFATYNITRKKTEAEVRRATGHKDSKSFCRYIIYDEG